MFSNRKNILNAAKENISKELYEALDLLLREKQEIIDGLDGEELPDHLADKLRSLGSRILEAETKITNWNQSKRRKKKKSIEWVDERSRKETVYSKPRRQINWEAAGEVIETRNSIKKNNSSWLMEGVMVVHKDDVKKEHPMMVIDIFSDGDASRVLLGSEVRTFRSLSLRPAFDD